MKYSIKKDKSLSTETSNVFKIIITGIANSLENVTYLLEYLFLLRKEFINPSLNGKWLLHPVYSDLTSCSDSNSAYYIESSNKLNKIFAEKGDLLQKIAYLSLVGVTDAINRNPLFREAKVFHIFSKDLYVKKDIRNVDLAVYFDSLAPRPIIRKIHAVHQSFLEDEEISSGLHISYRKKIPESEVLYVCSQATLELAVQICEPNTVLIIDGHWEHDKRSTHGVWECSSASEIAVNLAGILNLYPGKVQDIRLWGCEAGYLAEFSTLPYDFSLDNLQFRDESSHELATKPMSEFRNRARYYSKVGEFPFARNSLAGQIIYALNDKSVSITASNSRTYPYPYCQKASYNIASDSDKWRGPHFWRRSEDAPASEKYNKLRRVKSLTLKYVGEDLLENTSMWPSTAKLAADSDERIGEGAVSPIVNRP